MIVKTFFNRKANVWSITTYTKANLIA